MYLPLYTYGCTRVCVYVCTYEASQLAVVVKNPLVSAGNIRDLGSVAGLRRPPGGGHGDPPTPGFLPGESHGQRSLVGYSSQGHKESDLTEVTWHACRRVCVCVCIKWKNVVETEDTGFLSKGAKGRKGKLMLTVSLCVLS